MGRPKLKEGESLIEIPCKVPQWVVDQIEEIHIREDRPRSQIARRLIIRGLAALNHPQAKKELAKENLPQETRLRVPVAGKANANESAKKKTD